MVGKVLKTCFSCSKYDPLAVVEYDPLAIVEYDPLAVVEYDPLAVVEYCLLSGCAGTNGGKLPPGI